MSNSTDCLKKKVCVTVFLDELFEEVEEEERREPIQVSEVTESVEKIAEKPFKEPSGVDSDNDERINVPPKADTEQNQVQVRPRKHRRESKFSKNRYDSFKNELSKYGYVSCVRAENEDLEPLDSNVSDSDFDIDEFLGLNKWTLERSRSSFALLSECDMTEESFLSVSPALSLTTVACSKKRKNPRAREKSSGCAGLPVLYCNKSTQFEGAGREGNNSDGKLEAGIPPKKEKQKTKEDVSAWKKTQRQIQLILAEAKSMYQETEPCEGDRIRHYDLRSILEECFKTGERVPERNVPCHLKAVRSNASTEFNGSDLQEPSDSYTCVLPHPKENLESRPLEVKKVWTSTRRSIWNDGFESDVSEPDSGHYAKDIGRRPTQNDSKHCYTLCLKCEESESSERRERKCEESVEKLEHLGSPSSPSQKKEKEEEEEEKEEGSFVFQAVTHLADRTILGTILKAEQEKSEGGSAPEGPLPVEKINKNFAEGDTIAKPSVVDSRFILDLDTKEQLFVCDEILKHVGETKVIRNEIIVNRAEIELHPQDAAQEDSETLNPSQQIPSASEVFAEVFFNQKRSQSLEKNMTDAESEMVFAESENFCDNEDFFCSKFSIGPNPSLTFSKNHFQQDVCVVEFEDKLSRSKILRRMKTVEILGDNSLNDMKNISTEVILICENISNNEVCLEAWQSSASTLKSITEMKQCYLKDSKDSAMYLIEIPLHFTHPKKSSFSESDHFFKPSDSD